MGEISRWRERWCVRKRGERLEEMVRLKEPEEGERGWRDREL